MSLEVIPNLLFIYSESSVVETCFPSDDTTFFIIFVQHIFDFGEKNLKPFV